MTKLLYEIRGASSTAALPFMLALLHPATAQAYVGPGAGLTALGTIIALVLALALAIVGFVWYPLKRMRRRRAMPPDPAGTTTDRE